MNEDRLRRFLERVRQALLLVVYWIEDEYHLEPPSRYRRAQVAPPVQHD